MKRSTGFPSFQDLFADHADLQKSSDGCQYFKSSAHARSHLCHKVLSDKQAPLFYPVRDISIPQAFSSETIVHLGISHCTIAKLFGGYDKWSSVTPEAFAVGGSVAAYHCGFRQYELKGSLSLSRVGRFQNAWF